MQVPPGLVNVPEHKPLALPNAGVKEQQVCSCVLKGCAVSGQRNVICIEHHFPGQPHLGPTSAGPRGSWSCPCREHQESIIFLETVVLCNAQTCILSFPLLWRKIHHLVTDGNSFLCGMVHPQSPARSLKGDRLIKYADRWGNRGTKDENATVLQQGSGKAAIRCLLCSGLAKTLYNLPKQCVSRTSSD